MCTPATCQANRTQLLAEARALQLDLQRREQEIARLQGRLERAEGSLAEISRAMVVYAKAATAQVG